ncbi:hypothetical protein EDB83DRAFT_2534740 [Lactarius deliciosus]|nr:hypothetical protein EDB83DRAFT_2534740 [Lactarius deliciosus]
MNPDPLILTLASDSDKTFSKPLYAKPQVREQGKPHYTPEETYSLIRGHANQHRLDTVVNALHDVGLKAELHRYREYRHKAERIEQRLHALAQALGGVQAAAFVTTAITCAIAVVVTINAAAVIVFALSLLLHWSS